ncbi:MAG: Thiazole synthase/Archaeal ribulose 1 [Candidatus Alkanophagales archaeon MCA70_species_2]|nr:Thiazole synthase/Archaeal ribulose 1 [Candidatus Alkanophaga liquidiphilum]
MKDANLEIATSKAILERYTEDLLRSLDVDVAIVGAGPSGMTAAYFLAKGGAKTVVFERGLSVGGGMWGGGMMFSRIAVEEEARGIFEEFGITLRRHGDLYVADSVEAVSAICLNTVKAGAKIFSLISVEDVMVRDGRVRGLVINWSAVHLSNLHVDPLTVRAALVIDATGHDAEVCKIVTKKIGKKLATEGGDVVGEKPMWAELGEKEIVKNTQEIYPGLVVAGMAANAVAGAHRMGAVFGGMLLSGKKAAEVALEMLRREGSA